MISLFALLDAIVEFLEQKRCISSIDMRIFHIPCSPKLVFARSKAISIEEEEAIDSSTQNTTYVLQLILLNLLCFYFHPSLLSVLIQRIPNANARQFDQKETVFIGHLIAFGVRQ